MSKATRTARTPDLESGEVKGSAGDHSDDDRQSPQNQESKPTQAKFDNGDSSWPLYSLYSKVAEEEDNMKTERYQKDADATLIFTGLFSATLAAFIAVSFPELRQSSQDTAVFYLDQISKILADPNVANGSTPFILATPPVFYPPTYAIWVNALWFLSLAISLTGAMVATLGQEWVHRYTKIVKQSRFNPDQGARIRTIFANYAPGSCTYHIWGTGRLSLYLHLSFFLFVAGVLISLFNNNRAAFYVISSWFAVFMTGYALVTIEAIFKPGALFYTPLSPLVFRLYLYISYAVSHVGSNISPLQPLFSSAARHYRDLRDNYHHGFLQGKRDAVVKEAATRSSKVDAVVLEWTLDHLGEDKALETFFEATPGFFNSHTDGHHNLPAVVRTKFKEALDGFLERTFSSNSIPEIVRSRRFVICHNATQAALGPDAVRPFEDRWRHALTSAEGVATDL